MRVNEIFYSIQGEGRYTGTPAIFIRLAGCNLRCNFCDTEHQPYQDLTEEEIMRQIADFPASHIVITGGEPMLQITQSLTIDYATERASSYRWKPTARSRSNAISPSIGSPARRNSTFALMPSCGSNASTS